MAFQIVRNDITKVSADAIVNTANPNPVCGGGTDTAIYQAAGAEKLLAARKEIGVICPGEAFATPAFDLDAEYIIHTVGPVWEGGASGEYETLASCYRRSLSLAKELKCESVAFPLISTGAYDFPKDVALGIATSEIKSFLEKEDDMEVILVVFDRDSFVLSGQIYDGVDAFIDGNYVEEKLMSEYAGESVRMKNSVSGNSRSRRESGKPKNKLRDLFHKSSLKTGAFADAESADEEEYADVEE